MIEELKDLQRFRHIAFVSYVFLLSFLLVLKHNINPDSLLQAGEGTDVDFVLNFG